MTRTLLGAALIASTLAGMGALAPQTPLAQARTTNPDPRDPALTLYAASFDYWGAYYGVSPIDLETISACEDPSGNPWALSSTGDEGIMQFHATGPGVWDLTPEGQAGLSPFDVDVDTQIRDAAWLFSLGYRSAWSCAQ